MNDFIEALREIKKENKDFKITLSRKEVLELVNEFDRLNNIIKEVREIFKDYGEKEDIVGYSMYNITGELLIKLLEILDKVGNSDE